MKLEKAIGLLQGIEFDMEEAFHSDLGGEVYASYTLRVADAETLIGELDIDLSSVSDYDDLWIVVDGGLNDSFDGGVDGVVTV